MLFENKRGHVWKLTYTIDNCEVKVRIVLRDGFHDRRLGEADADDQIITTLCEGAHGRLNRSGISRLYIAQDDIHGRLSTTRLAIRHHTGFGALYSGPCSSVERAIVFAADVEDDANMRFGFVVRAIAGRVAGRCNNYQRGNYEQGKQNLEFHKSLNDSERRQAAHSENHSSITSLISAGNSTGASSPNLYAALMRAAARRPRSSSAQKTVPIKSPERSSSPIFASATNPIVGSIRSSMQTRPPPASAIA